MLDNLKDWAIEFLKSKDCFTQQITKIEKTNYGFKVFKGGIFIDCLVIPKIKNTKLVFDFLKDGEINVFCENSKINLLFLIENWNQFLKYPNLKFYFVNQKSTAETKWVICPFMHNRITEKDNLEKGLKAMFATVNPL